MFFSTDTTDAPWVVIKSDVSHQRRLDDLAARLAHPPQHREVATRTACGSSKTPRPRSLGWLPRGAASSRRCTYLHENEAQRLGLVGDALVEHRRRLIGPLAEQLKKWCAAVAPTLLPSEPLMAAVGYYQRHHKALFRFIDDANVPIDNSATEREFQNVAKLRLNVLFARSTEGAHRACVLLGIVATCRTLGVPVQASSPGPSSASVRTAMSSTSRSRR